ncbi:hypothetical protein GCM10028796_19740 [Ramlibacter monticola]|uniref:Lipoprotein n=1 Tax=Ramlibacter monticola TaxID=1926872 RepID=A0A936Z201_9BURK|nr:hypothetical protein [Ramlibacter monticola]MBL0392230.1 hypothetical protein [Ramlibacter monticola]
MDKACIVAVLLLLAGCSGMPATQPPPPGSAASSAPSICHWGEVSYPCEAGLHRY